MSFVHGRKTPIRQMKMRLHKNQAGVTLLEQVISMALTAILLSCLAFIISGIIRNYLTLLNCTRAQSLSDQISDGINAISMDCEKLEIGEGDYGHNVTLEFDEGTSPLFYDGSFETFYVTDSLCAVGRPKVTGALSDLTAYRDYYVAILLIDNMFFVYVLDDDPMFWSSVSVDANGRLIDSSSFHTQISEHCCAYTQGVLQYTKIIKNPPPG